MGEKQNKKKRSIIIALVSIVVVLVVCYIFIFSPRWQNENTSHERVFANHGQTITLNTNGTFQAVLAHGVRINGTYNESVQNNEIIISFVSNGVSAYGRITENGRTMHLPREWDDGHGHGNIFRLR
jgi:magnesium-transporting ATPase (P-type)